MPNILFLFLYLFACEDAKKDTAESEDDTSSQTSAYDSCSLELVAASGPNFSAMTIAATSVRIEMAFGDDEHGVQTEMHTLDQAEESEGSINWTLELTQVDTPSEVISGTSTLWNIFTDGDLVFLASNEDNDLCDCWAIKGEYGSINCDTFIGQ
jgi:hypothetical protein